MNASRGSSCPDDVLLLLRGIGLLEAEEERRVEGHVATCARCEGRLVGLRQGAGVPRSAGKQGHVPAAVLARLREAQDAVPRADRVAIDRHIERCPTCREERELLDRLRAGAPSVAARPRRSRALPWLGGYAALATAAALVFALRGTVATPPPQDQARTTSAPTERPAPAPTPAIAVDPAVPRATGLEVRLIPRAARPLAPTLRGAVEHPPLVRRDREARALRLRIEPLLAVADDAAVAIELLDAGTGRVRARAEARWRDLHGGRDVLLTSSGEPIPAGAYVLRVRALAPDPSSGAPGEAVEYRFELGAPP